MTELEAIYARHSVRRYTDRPVWGEVEVQLREEIRRCNEESGLRMQLITDEPEAFGSILAHYGLFKGVRNYIAIVGRETKELPEKAGYYGERIVLKAQMLGLNTCWVAATYSKRKSRIAVAEGERVVCVITVGYGATQGRPHRNRPVSALCRVEREPAPDWFWRGVEAAMLAPTAVNRQQFCMIWTGETVKAQATAGGLAHLDLGIVKYHFEVGAGKGNFNWTADE